MKAGPFPVDDSQPSVIRKSDLGSRVIGVSGVGS
jgi:hypothetical protein